MRVRHLWRRWRGLVVGCLLMVGGLCACGPGVQRDAPHWGGALRNNGLAIPDPQATAVVRLEIVKRLRARREPETVTGSAKEAAQQLRAIAQRDQQEPAYGVGTGSGAIVQRLPVDAEGTPQLLVRVLTAAHNVLDEVKRPGAASRVSPLPAIRAFLAGAYRTPIHIFVHPSYERAIEQGTGGRGADDEAVLTFLIPASRSVPEPLSIADSEPHRGDRITMWGYGRPSPDGESGQLRAGDNRVRAVANGRLYSRGPYGPDHPDWRDAAAREEVVAYPGDSGGPILNAAGKLVAIIRGGFKVDGQPSAMMVNADNLVAPRRASHFIRGALAPCEAIAIGGRCHLYQGGNLYHLKDAADCNHGLFPPQTLRARCGYFYH